jgi:hypothetical protein
LEKELATVSDIPQSVNWKGGNSIVPLLYVPDVSVYPAQIKGDYTFYDLDDTDKLTKFGLWSEELSGLWLQDADVILIEDSEYEGELRESIEKAGLNMIDRTSAPFNCRPQNEILVFQQP